MSNPLKNLHPSTCRDGGLGGVFYAMRPSGPDIEIEGSTLGDFLSKPEHFGGKWLLEMGQGGPPGRYVVEWIDDAWVWRGCR